MTLWCGHGGDGLLVGGGDRGDLDGDSNPGDLLWSQVRRAVVQVISAMAHHGYLEQPGGEAMLEFLVRQCALPSDAVRIAWPLIHPQPSYILHF